MGKEDLQVGDIIARLGTQLLLRKWEVTLPHWDGPVAGKNERDCFLKDLSKLRLYRGALCPNYVEKYNSWQIQRKNIPIDVLVEDNLIIDSRFASEERTWGSILNECLMKLVDEPHSRITHWDELYLRGAGNLFGISPFVATGYIEMYNALREKISREENYAWKNVIMDYGNSRFGIIRERMD